MKFYILISVILQLNISIFTAFAAQNEDCIIQIANGTVTGFASETTNPTKKFCSYLGIPFAMPPVDELRFKPPQPSTSFGFLNATKFPARCPQAGTPLLPGLETSEDCLYLNVFQPITSQTNLPVMIWFYGGAFTGGSSELYSPTKLLARGDVILVVVHYRVGILGFFSTGDDLSSGNQGLKDQSKSIHWVHENIAAFNGNPDQITLFGQSAGGVGAMNQLLSPLNKGLIKGVISQSGTALVPRLFDPDPISSSKIIADLFNCPSSSSQEILDCLKLLFWETIIEVQTAFIKENDKQNILTRAGITPVSEDGIEGAFLTGHPEDIMKNGEFDKIPVMLGCTKHDASMFLASIYLDYLSPNGLDKHPGYMRNQIIPDILKRFSVQENIKGNRATASSIELAYLGGVNRSSWNESMPGLVDLITVYMYKSHVMNTADLLSERGLDVFLYSFEHHSLNTAWNSLVNASAVPIQGGITHGDDLLYLFDLPGDYSSRDINFSEKMIDMWINFAVFGNPTTEESERWQQWPVYNSNEQFYMKLNETPTVMTNYRSSWRPNGFEWN